MNYVNPLLYPVNVRNFPRFGCGILYIFLGDLTSKSALLLLALLSASKKYTGCYLLCSTKQEVEWSIMIYIVPLILNKKATFSAISYWNMMIILYLIWMFLKCYLSPFSSQSSHQRYLVISVSIFRSIQIII